MAVVSEVIVREYLESLGFLVLQPHKHKVVARVKRTDEEVDMLAIRPGVKEQVIPDEVLWTGLEMKKISRALIGVRGWHTDRFSPAVLTMSPEIFRFAAKEVEDKVLPLTGGGPAAKILCLSGLPASGALKKKSLEMFKEKGIDGVLFFRTMLAELASKTDKNKNYERSDLLQTLRILKNYDLLKDSQLELFNRGKKRK